MANSKKREKDQRMARHIRNERRSSGPCPICYKVVAIGKLEGHLRQHGG